MAPTPTVLLMSAPETRPDTSCPFMLLQEDSRLALDHAHGPAGLHKEPRNPGCRGARKARTDGLHNGPFLSRPSRCPASVHASCDQGDVPSLTGKSEEPTLLNRCKSLGEFIKSIVHSCMRFQIGLSELFHTKGNIIIFNRFRYSS